MRGAGSTAEVSTNNPGLPWTYDAIVVQSVL